MELTKQSLTSPAAQMRIVEFEILGRSYKFATNNDDVFTDQILGFVRDELKLAGNKAGSSPQLTQLILVLISLSERFLRLEKEHSRLKNDVIESSEKTLALLERAAIDLNNSSPPARPLRFSLSETTTLTQRDV